MDAITMLKSKLDALREGWKARFETAEPVTFRRGRRIFKAMDGALEAVEKGAADVAKITGDSRYTLEHRRGQARQILATTKAGAQASIRQAQEQTDALIRDLERQALPPRPGPESVAQEARIGNLKADVRMVCDPLPPENVPAKLLELAKRYALAGDALGVWLMGASDFPALYLESRGAQAVEYDAGVGEALASAFEPDQVGAREALAFITGPQGLKAAVTIGLNALDMRLASLEASIQDLVS